MNTIFRWALVVTISFYVSFMVSEQIISIDKYGFLVTVLSWAGFWLFVELYSYVRSKYYAD